MATSQVREPALAVRPRPIFWTARFGKRFGSAAGVAIVGVVSLLVSGNLLLPFRSVPTLEGKTASKGELFQDEQMQALLRRHHLKVHVTRNGSMSLWEPEMAKKYAFVFPSGQAAADEIKSRIGGSSTEISKPFASPLVLATYRQYADTLVESRAATPQGDDASPMYYDLDMSRFMALVDERKTWDGLGISRHRDADGRAISSANRVVAHIPGMCRSNSGQSFVALAAFARGRNEMPTPENVRRVAGEIKDLFDVQGLPDADPFDSYVTPEGRSKAPIIVIYEHQFLAYQLQHAESTGAPDRDRVLLYPTPEVTSDPEFIPLTEDGAVLSRLLTNDQDIRKRAMELGFRMKGSGAGVNSEALWRHLSGHGIPPPSQQVRTQARIPELPILKTLVDEVGDCPG